MEVLCSDKTGTMTLNKLELKEPWTFGKFKKEELLLYAGLALKQAAPDAIDQSIIECMYLSFTHYSLIHCSNRRHIDTG